MLVSLLTSFILFPNKYMKVIADRLSISFLSQQANDVFFFHSSGTFLKFFMFVIM